MHLADCCPHPFPLPRTTTPTPLPLGVSNILLPVTMALPMPDGVPPAPPGPVLDDMEGEGMRLGAIVAFWGSSHQQDLYRLLTGLGLAYRGA
jgi:hypothetical protein